MTPFLPQMTYKFANMVERLHSIYFNKRLNLNEI
jgi:hypothetical protein